MKIRSMLGALILVLAVAFLPARASVATVSSIASQLVCQCGCTLLLENCTHEECHSRENMNALIVQQLDQGQSEEQIIQLFVTQYGEQVLASPPKKGFNLTAWILPFAVILVGGGVIYFLIKKWVRTGRYATVVVDAEEDESDNEYERKLEAELKSFSEGSFR